MTDPKISSIVTWPYVLRKGHSDNPSHGACAMDAVNWLVHGIHGDHPECACPVISAYVIRGNDEMPDDVRQRLLDYLPRISGSRSPEHEAVRLRIMVLAAVHVFAASALQSVGLVTQAECLRNLPNDISYKNLAAAARARATAAHAARAGAAAAAAATVLATAAAAAAANAAAQAAHTTAAGAAAHAAAHAAVGAAAGAAAGAVWDDYFLVLDEALAAGPVGESWSADAVVTATANYKKAGGLEVVSCDR
jgi:hypothetical protein